MTRRATILALVVVAGLTVACSRSEQASADSAEEAFTAFRTAWNEAESSEAKASLAADYLARFPDTEHSGSMAWRIAYYRGKDAGDAAGAWAAISAALPQITDPEQRFEAGMAALSLADKVEIPLDLAQIAGDLEAVRPLTYSEHSDVAETAIDLELWPLADEHSAAALELATPEMFRADYPDRDFTDEQVATRVRYRRAMQMAMNGWAKYNLGETDGAMERFLEASEIGSVNYMGVPNTPLNLYWGRAALAEGDTEAAIDLLGAEALFGDNREAAEADLRKAFTADNESEGDFGEFLWKTRHRLAKPAADFELADYQGTPHRLSDSAGDVTLLAFWFPT
jgi:hypothetical protein